MAPAAAAQLARQGKNDDDDGVCLSGAESSMGDDFDAVHDAEEKPAACRADDGIMLSDIENSPASDTTSDSESNSSPSSSASGSSDCLSERADGLVEGIPEMPPLTLPLITLGVTFRNDPFTHREHSTRSHRRIIASCLYHGSACKKKRGRGPNQVNRFGEWEPIAFGLAWSRGGSDFSRGRHVPWEPSVDEVSRAFFDLYDAHGTPEEEKEIQLTNL